MMLGARDVAHVVSIIPWMIVHNVVSACLDMARVSLLSSSKFARFEGLRFTHSLIMFDAM